MKIRKINFKEMFLILANVDATLRGIFTMRNLKLHALKRNLHTFEFLILPHFEIACTYSKQAFRRS